MNSPYLPAVIISSESQKHFQYVYCREHHPIEADRCPRKNSALFPAHKLINLTIDNNFTVSEMIGEGNNGVIYICESLTTKTLFAVKFFKLDTRKSRTERIFENLKNEANTVELLEHHNIVEIEGTGVTSDGIPYIIMELLKGSDLGGRRCITGPISFLLDGPCR